MLRPFLPPSIASIVVGIRVVVVVVHHIGSIPTLTLTSEKALSGSGIALRLLLHPCLKDARVRKIY